VVTTGTFTIPLMKRIGYPPSYAGAIEAVASSGGQITPPILGVTAFIIADFLGVSYLSVAIAAIAPALLYYVALFCAVDFAGRRRRIGHGERAEPLLAVLRRDGHLGLAPIVIVVLLVNGFSAVAAGIYGSLTLLAVCALRPHTRFSPLQLMAALQRGAQSALPISMACACSGIIIGAIFASALGVHFTNALVGIAGDHLWIALALVMLAAFILGMGMTTSADYIILSVLAVPTLTALGANPLAAHMFVFYFASISGITPPVALAAFAAAGIAGANMYATGVTATRIGVSAYLIPFVFIYHPELLMQGEPLEAVGAFAASLVAVGCLAGASEGWLLGPARLWQRASLAVAALLLITLQPWPVAAGLGIFAVAALTTWRRREAVA
jgi:TRAP transporter 4TM/12TM fusion protein